MKRELIWAARLIHLPQRSLAAEWSPVVHCFDASWWGFGIVKKHVRKEVVRDAARRCERWRFAREHGDRWRTRHIDGDPAIRQPGRLDKGLGKIGPCQRIKDEEEKETLVARVAPRPPCTGGDLIATFIKQGGAERGTAKEEDDRKSSDEDSCSEPSQWWGEAPKFKERKAGKANREKTDAVDVTPGGGGNAPPGLALTQTSLCEPEFLDAPVEIWGGCWSRVLSKPWEAAEPQCILEARAAILTLKHF